jgi:hypothetical protein
MNKKDSIRHFADRIEKRLPSDHTVKVKGEDIIIDTGRVGVGTMSFHWREIDWFLSCFAKVQMDAEDDLMNSFKRR